MIRRRRRMKPIIPLASMADIAFLLIIFFMLAGTIEEKENMQLDLAQSEDVEKLEKVKISVTLDADGVLRLQGNEATAGGLDMLLEEMLEGSEDRKVKVKIDKGLPKDIYMPVFEALGRAGVTLELLGEEEQKP